MTRRKLPQGPTVAVRALRTKQAEDVDVYSFFVAGADLLKFAEISRIKRNAQGQLQGFQRKDIRSHVQAIVDFLDQGAVLFPNAIILALSKRAVFVRSRGEKPEGDSEIAQAGTLRIPISDEGEKAAWIVDGQQRSLALARARNRALPVPVVAFVSEDLSLHREQFILVNKARPLSARLINELLPEVQSRLPKDLAPRRVPSVLVNMLNTEPDSPFFELVRRPSDTEIGATITDTALVKMIKNSINSPLGALAPFKSAAPTDAQVMSMYRVLVAFWTAVKNVFPDAWGRIPTESRLMHSAGIEAMGWLMDRVMGRPPEDCNLFAHAKQALTSIAPSCKWTGGRWDDIGRDWNDIQNTPRDIRLLTHHLVRLDRSQAFSRIEP